jgi:hypothetical protein
MCVFTPSVAVPPGVTFTAVTVKTEPLTLAVMFW